jgi:hypothetical protein
MNIQYIVSMCCYLLYSIFELPPTNYIVTKLISDIDICDKCNTHNLCHNVTL